MVLFLSSWYSIKIQKYYFDHLELTIKREYMRLLTFCTLTTILFLMTSCQKENIQPTEINSTTENLIINPNVKGVENTLIAVSPAINDSGLTSGFNPPSGNNAMDVVTFLKDSQEFSSFYSALFKTGMIDDLDGDGPFTLFVPDNQAFQTFLMSNNWNTIDDIPLNILNLIVKFHISTTAINIGDLTNSAYVPIMFNDKNVYINMDDPNNPFVVLGLTSADILKSDLTQSNGVIHHINGVLSL